MQKHIIAAAAASVLSLASYGFAQTTLVRQNFETDTSRRGINFNSADPANNNIPANVGTTSVSNPSFGPATNIADSQDNVEIIDPAAAFNAFAGSISSGSDLNNFVVGTGGTDHGPAGVRCAPPVPSFAPPPGKWAFRSGRPGCAAVGGTWRIGGPGKVAPLGK